MRGTPVAAVSWHVSPKWGRFSCAVAESRHDSAEIVASTVGTESADVDAAMKYMSEALCAVCGHPITPSEVRTERAGRSIHIRCWVVDASPTERSAPTGAARRRPNAGTTT